MTDNIAVDEGQEQVESAPTDEEQLQNEESEEASAEDTGESRKKKGAERRIRQLTRKYRETERRAEKLERELQEIKERIGPKPEPVRPNRDDYDTDEEYEDALFDWRDAVKTKATPETEEAELPPIVKEFESELEELADDAVLAVMDDDWPCTKEMTDYIMASENRAKLAYHLATHTDIAEKITKMSPILAARELAKVEESLGSSNDNSVTTLPPPATTGKPSAVGLTDQDKMSTAQWVEKRRRGEI